MNSTNNGRIYEKWGDDGHENVCCGIYEGGREAVLEWEARGFVNLRFGGPHIINKAALTVIGDRAAQRN